MLGYIHFLQKHWEKNKEKLKLSDTFLDFSFWDIPRFKQPLLLIPIVIAFAIFIQVSLNSSWLLVIFVSILLLVGSLIFARFRYHLSPNRHFEKLINAWSNDAEWLEKWSRRINKQLSLNIGVKENDLYEAGMTRNQTDRAEIVFALHKYFEKHEFEDDLVLMRVSELHYFHPLHEYESY